MRKMKRVLAVLILAWGATFSLYASTCKFGVKPVSWSKQVYSFCVSTNGRINATLRSPDHEKHFVVRDSKPIVKLGEKGNVISGKGGEPIIDPALIAWSPDSSAVFINDSGGSGLDGWTLRVYEIGSDRVIYRELFQRKSLQLMKRHLKCAEPMEDVANVFGIGWYEDRELAVIAQVMTHSKCGEPGSYRGFLFDSHTGQVKRDLSERQARRYFGAAMPEVFQSTK